MSADESPYDGSNWNAGTAVAAPDRSRLTADLDVDVCVIGGGLAGLTTARELARRGWSVAVLEARRVAWSASGRNTGFVIPGFARDFDGLIERAGLERAKALWALSEAGVDYVRNTIAETAMPGVEPVNGWLNVSKLDNGDGIVKIVALLGENGIEVEGWPEERVRDVLKSKSYFHAIHYPRAFHIHPLNYALGLAAAAEAAGARIFEQTPALSIDAAGVRKRVATPDGRVRATHVVLAGNTDLAGVMPQIGGTVVPITTYVIVTGHLGERLHETIAYRGAVSDTQMADNHYRVVDGDRLMWSGGMTTWQADPKGYVARLRRDIARTFPQLDGVPVEYRWSGTLGRTVHNMPQIGEISRGLWIAGGFGGHGLDTTAMAGQVIARAIAESDQAWRLFAPYELIWAGGAAGRLFAQARYCCKRPFDLWREKRSRQREASHHRKLALAEAGQPQVETVVQTPALEQGTTIMPVETSANDIPSVEVAAPAPERSKTGGGNGARKRKGGKRNRARAESMAAMSEPGTES